MFKVFKMKLLILLCAVVAFVICMDPEFLAKSTERTTKYVAECMETVEATKDDMAELMQIKIPSSKKAKCMMACYHKKYGIQDKDGKLDKAASIEAMKDLKVADPELYEKAVKLFDICMDHIPNEKCECDTAANFMYCFNIHGSMMDLKPGMVPM